MKLHIYNANCVGAGTQVTQNTLDQYDGDIDDAGDWHIVEGTPVEMLAAAWLADDGCEFNKARTILFALVATDHLHQVTSEALGYG